MPTLPNADCRLQKTVNRNASFFGIFGKNERKCTVFNACFKPIRSLTQMVGTASSGWVLRFRQANITTYRIYKNTTVAIASCEG